MATKKKNTSSGSWKKERASVNRKQKPKPKSNKYSTSDSRQKASTPRDHYWRAGYTRKDGTQVKGHYVKMPS